MDWDTSKAEFSVNHHYKVWAEADLSNDVDQTDNIMFLDCKIRILEVLPKDWNLAPEHTNNDYTIKWEFPDNFKEDGSTAHNHRRSNPFYALCVWDNRHLMRDDEIGLNWFDKDFDTVKPWYFYYGHGFISKDTPLRYYFASIDSWSKEAVKDIRNAFAAWNGLNDPSDPGLVTGIFFQEITSVSDVNNPGKDAEIVLYWTDLGDYTKPEEGGKLGGTWFPWIKVGEESKRIVNIAFNSRDPLTEIPFVKWYFGDPDQMPEDEVWGPGINPPHVYFYYIPFYSTALHEIGHALGLDHLSEYTQPNIKEVMATGGATGKRGASKILGETRERALDLYSICNDHYFKATVHSPAHILVTDPLDRQAGYDSITASFLNNIPYTKISEYDTGPESVTIPWPLDGTYVIQLIGIADGPYTLNLTLSTNSSTLITQTFSGTITNGSIQTFTVDTTASSFTLYSWDHVFKDTKRDTILRINTKDKYFQFIAPDKDFGVKYDPKMAVLKRVIIICYEDKEMRLIATAVDDKIDFCSAIAYDKQIRKTYILIDKPNC